MPLPYQELITYCPHGYAAFHLNFANIITTSKALFSNKKSNFFRELEDCIAYLWEANSETLDPMEAFALHDNILGNNDNISHMLTCVQLTIKKNKNIKKLAEQSSDLETIGILEDQQNIILFMYRLLKTLTSNQKLLQIKAEQLKEFINLLFFRIDVTFDIISSGLEGRFAKHFYHLISIEGDILYSAEKSLSTIKNQLQYPLLLTTEQKNIFENIIIFSRKWILYKAKISCVAGLEIKKAPSLLEEMDSWPDDSFHLKLKLERQAIEQKHIKNQSTIQFHNELLIAFEHTQKKSSNVKSKKELTKELDESIDTLKILQSDILINPKIEKSILQKAHSEILAGARLIKNASIHKECSNDVCILVKINIIVNQIKILTQKDRSCLSWTGATQIMLEEMQAAFNLQIHSIKKSTEEEKFKKILPQDFIDLDFFKPSEKEIKQEENKKTKQARKAARLAASKIEMVAPPITKPEESNEETQPKALAETLNLAPKATLPAKPPVEAAPPKPVITQAPKPAPKLTPAKPVAILATPKPAVKEPLNQKTTPLVSTGTRTVTLSVTTTTTTRIIEKPVTTLATPALVAAPPSLPIQATNQDSSLVCENKTSEIEILKKKLQRLEQELAHSKEEQRVQQNITARNIEFLQYNTAVNACQNQHNATFTDPALNQLAHQTFHLTMQTHNLSKELAEQTSKTEMLEAELASLKEEQNQEPQYDALVYVPVPSPQPYFQQPMYDVPSYPYPYPYPTAPNPYNQPYYTQPVNAYFPPVPQPVYYDYGYSAPVHPLAVATPPPILVTKSTPVPPVTIKTVPTEGKQLK